MRATVVGGLIFFHTARIFDPLDFYVKDQPPNLPLTLFVLFAGLWGMPLLFVVSGLGRLVLAPLPDRDRLRPGAAGAAGVPFLVGLLVVIPPQVYYQLRFEQQDPGSYWQFYRDFFQIHLGIKFPWFIRPDDPPDLFEPAHLWFLYFLLVYSLVLLPALLYLRGSGRQLLERLASLRQTLGELPARPARGRHRGGPRHRGVRGLEPLCLPPVPAVRVPARCRPALR